MNRAAATAPVPASAEDASIRPFRIAIDDEALDDLRRRIAATRWPSRELVSDATQGVPLRTMQQLAARWHDGYDWRKVEARLNELPQFVTNIDGVDIHFIHVCSSERGALPIILTHGWPGSILEHLKLVDALVNPAANGGSSSDAFDLVIPSMPGYGFSGKPATPGWDPVRIARAWIVLMERLGLSRYVAAGGDWGGPITEQMALLAPSAVAAIHLNMPSAVPAEIASALHSGGPAPEGLPEDERRAFDRLAFFFGKGLGYANEMRLRPQTLDGIEDSPVGLAAWMLDHDDRSLAMIARAFDGGDEGLTRDDVLDNVTLYWLTKTGISSARLYWENRIVFFAPLGVTTPTAVSAYPDELYQAPRSWCERAYPNLIHYNRMPKGGHFAAWEQPELYVSELRAAFRSLR